MKTILITGAASGIGRATAELFFRAGWRLGLFDVVETPLLELARQFGADRCRIQVVDVTQADQVERAIAQFMQGLDQLDVLFNCAGVLEIGDFESIPLQRHHQILDINNKGVLNCSYLALPFLKKATGARVINMSSASSLYGIPGFTTYSASKFWVKGFTEALNMEWSRYGIHVTDVEPPFVKTAMLSGKQAKIIDRMGVSLTAEDIARAVLAAAEDSGIHHPVSVQYRTMRTLRKYLPDVATKTLIKLMSGY